MVEAGECVSSSRAVDGTLWTRKENRVLKMMARFHNSLWLRRVRFDCRGSSSVLNVFETRKVFITLALFTLQLTMSPSQNCRRSMYQSLHGMTVKGSNCDGIV